MTQLIFQHVFTRKLLIFKAGQLWSIPTINYNEKPTAIFHDIYSRLSLSRLRLSRITAYLEEKIWSLF